MKKNSFLLCVSLCFCSSVTMTMKKTLLEAQKPKGSPNMIVRLDSGKRLGYWKGFVSKATIRNIHTHIAIGNVHLKSQKQVKSGFDLANNEIFLHNHEQSEFVVIQKENGKTTIGDISKQVIVNFLLVGFTLKEEEFLDDFVAEFAKKLLLENS